jgi:hypothetical protein
MERIRTEDAALLRLTRLTQAASSPDITADLADILVECKLAVLWTASTLYKVGDVVQPNTPNGHRYICIQGGTSGTSEPDWLTTDVKDSRSYRGTIIEDGSSDPILTWREDGEEYASLWDMRRAAYLGWQEKISKAVCAVDASGDGTSVKNSQVYEHCKEQAAKFMPVMIG